MQYLLIKGGIFKQMYDDKNKSIRLDGKRR